MVAPASLSITGATTGVVSEKQYTIIIATSLHAFFILDGSGVELNGVPPPAPVLVAP